MTAPDRKPLNPAEKRTIREAAAKATKNASPAKADPTADFKAKHPLYVKGPAVEQLMGDEKYSYQITTDAGDVKKRIGAAFSTFAQESKSDKAGRVAKALGTPKIVKGKEAVGGSRAMGDYPKALRLGPVADRMLDSASFATFEIRTDPADAKRLYLLEKEGGPPVALLLLGIEKVFTPAPIEGSARQGVTKHHNLDDGPTHVLDDADVPTRRFAFFETSRQQLMAALGEQAEGKLPPALRGRYIRHREAMGLTTAADKVSGDMKQVSAADPDLADLYGVAPGAISPDLMANIHQYLGSGMNQRGLSLASTPKEQIYSNDGDSFKSVDGVRIQVDLAKVPKNVILLNHYAEGGVGTRLKAKPPAGFEPNMLERDAKGEGYNYARSVVKNRELLLQELRPEWIVDITDHLQSEPGKKKVVAGPANRKAPQRTEQMREALGYAHYETGRALGAAGKPATDTLTEKFAIDSHVMGHRVGVEEKAGREQAAGHITEFWKAFDAFRPKPRKGKKATAVPDPAAIPAPAVSPVAKVATAAAKRLKVAQRKELLSTKPAWYVLVSLHRAEKFLPDMHDSYWLAWAATAGVSPKVATGEAKPPELKAEGKVEAPDANPTATGVPVGKAGVVEAKTPTGKDH